MHCIVLYCYVIQYFVTGTATESNRDHTISLHNTCCTISCAAV